MHSFVNEFLSFGVFYFEIFYLQIYWVLIFAWFKSGFGMAMGALAAFSLLTVDPMKLLTCAENCLPLFIPCVPMAISGWGCRFGVLI